MVKWRGYESDVNPWEPEVPLTDCGALDTFLACLKDQPRSDSESPDNEIVPELAAVSQVLLNNPSWLVEHPLYINKRVIGVIENQFIQRLKYVRESSYLEEQVGFRH